MTYEEWIEQVPDNIKNDPLWSFEVYPKALLLFDFAWADCDRLAQDHRAERSLSSSSTAPVPSVPTLKKAMVVDMALIIAVFYASLSAPPAKPGVGIIAVASYLIRRF